MRENSIEYIEFVSKNFARIKKFYTEAFGWEFADWGPDYMAFVSGHVAGGFTKGDAVKGSILVIMYSSMLEEAKKKVEGAGGVIVRDIYKFPGGKRFEFTDPDGNELAVWSDK